MRYLFCAKKGITICAKNGVTIESADDDEAYDLVIAVASGRLTEVDEIADVLRGFAVPV